MKHTVNIDRIAVRVHGRVDDPRALAEAISKTVAARLAADLAAGGSSAASSRRGQLRGQIASIDAGRFSVDEAPEGAAEAVADALSHPPETTGKGDA